MATQSKYASPYTPLSQDELDELDNFLMSDQTSDETMGVTSIDGYLTAIASGPVILKPGEWMPGIWGPTEGDRPEFETTTQAAYITELIIRHFNAIIFLLQNDPDAIEPVFDDCRYQSEYYIDGEMWAYGYMNGIELCRSHWQPLFDDQDGWNALRPIYLLGADDVTPEEEALTQTPSQREKLSKQIPASVVRIFRYWQAYRDAVAERAVARTFQRNHPKIGRNDPCPCGSGMKFKKCCGSAATLH